MGLGGSARTIWTVSNVLASQRAQHCLPSATRAATLLTAGTTALVPSAPALTAPAHRILLTTRPRAAFKTRSACLCPSNRVRHCMPQLAWAWCGCPGPARCPLQTCMCLASTCPDWLCSPACCSLLCTQLWHLPAALPPPRGLDEAGRPSLAWQPPKYVNASSLFRAYYKNTRGPETTLYV